MNRRPIRLLIGSIAGVAMAVFVAPGGGGNGAQVSLSSLKASSHATIRLTPLQGRLLSGTTSTLLGQLGIQMVYAETPSAGAKVFDSVNQDAIDVAPNFPPGGAVAGAGVAGGPANVVPNADGVCAVRLGKDTRVNTDCENASDPAFHGRGEAQNETSIAANPLDPQQIIAEQNDYRRGDGGCGGDFSLDGGKTWGSSLLPSSFVIDPNTGKREYWQASGDPSVAWDSSGTAYIECMAFNRGGGATNSSDQKSGIFMFRSDNKGASWVFTGRTVTYQVASDATHGLPLSDKPYLAIDANPTSPNRDNLYVTWTLFAPDGSATIEENYSTNHGETWNGPVVVSKSSSLCPNSVGASGTCDANQFSNPVVAPNGDLYVAWDNYNNAVTPTPTCVSPPFGTIPCDNRNQVLLAKSTDGGKSFSAPVRVADFFDLPSCYLYTGGQDFGRGCVPVKAAADAAHQPSVFRAANYPSMVVDPKDATHVLVTFGSYINANSNAANGCVPAGFGGDGNNAYSGVTTAGACNNDIVLSESHNGGSTFTGTTTDPQHLPTVNVDHSLTDKWWQWAAITSDGTLVTGFYDRQYGTDETTGFSDYTVVAGDRQVRATTSSNPPPTEFPNGAGHSLFMGDYSGLTVAGDRALPFWTDTRDIGVTSCPSDVRQLCSFGNDEDVFTARINLNGED